MNQAIMAAARRYMTGLAGALELDAEVCVSCGVKRATERVSKAFNSSFNQTAFLLYDSQYICRQCLELFKDKTSRSKCLYFPEPGKKILLDREAVLPLLAVPPSNPFVLCLPYSFQKHVFFYAGVSTDKCAWISTDERTVKLDYEAHDVPGMIQHVRDMLVKGVPRKELISRDYSVFTKAKFKDLEVWEERLAPMRPDGAVELIATYSPPTKTRVKYEVVPMAFSETEVHAIDILVDLARASKFRSQDGISFWNTYFKRRINRSLRAPDLHIFFSQVAGAIDCDTSKLQTGNLEALDPESAALVMEEIKSKTDLLLAAAYTKHKTFLDFTKKKANRNEINDLF